jgi:hypothetical protein
MRSKLFISITVCLVVWSFGTVAIAVSGRDSCMDVYDSFTGRSALEKYFLEALRGFLDASKARDNAKFYSYLRDDIPMYHVLPGPRVIDNLAAYEASQNQWMNGQGGFFDYRVHDVAVSGDLGHGSVYAVYENIDLATLRPFHLDLYISFLFKRIDGRWYMVHSQNSIINEQR